MEKHKHPFLNTKTAKVRLLNEFMKYKSLIVAFDFDNTIYDYHQKGDDYSEVIDLLKRCCEYNFTMILFTADTDEEKLEWKKKYCEELGIRVDYVNESPVMNGTKKPYYNILLDDRAGLFESYYNLKFIIDCIDLDVDGNVFANNVFWEIKMYHPDSFVQGFKRGLVNGRKEMEQKHQKSYANGFRHGVESARKENK